MAYTHEDDVLKQAAATTQSGEREAAAPDYTSPRLVSLGSVSALIQGYWNEGWADYGVRYKHAGD